MRLFTRRGGYCLPDPSVWVAEGVVCGGERSGVGRGGGRGADIVRVALISGRRPARGAFWPLLPTQHRSFGTVRCRSAALRTSLDATRAAQALTPYSEICSSLTSGPS